MMLKAGDLAPEFRLLDENGQLHGLSDYRGRPLVLYFYPKDDTSGCTTEACGFRDDYSAYENAGVAIIGVSADDTASHAKFINKYSLPFTLLADTEKKVVKAYEVWGVKKMYGREYEGILRTTFLIDASGRIVRIFEKVKPAEHSKEILQAIIDH